MDKSLTVSKALWLSVARFAFCDSHLLVAQRQQELCIILTTVVPVRKDSVLRHILEAACTVLVSLNTSMKAKVPRGKSALRWARMKLSGTARA